MDYGNLKVPENVTPEVQAILDRQKAVNKEIENAHRKNMFRIGLGSVLSGASAHPVFNIPYVGTGLGGALYELGQGITEGDKLPDIAKRTGTGFVIGETVGAIPYAGKYANKLSGGKIGNALTAGVEKIASTPLGQKVSEIAPKVEDLLMTDITPNVNKKPIYYHGTASNFDEFSSDFIGTAHDEGLYGKGFYFTPHKSLAQSYAKTARNGESPRVISAYLEMKNPLKMTNFNSAEDIAKYLDMEENVRDFILAEYGNHKIYRPNGFLQNTGKFKSRVMDLGHDAVIVGDNEVVVFSPNQIQQIKQPNLFNYLSNDSFLTKGYRQNKDIIDTQASKLYEYLKDYNSIKPGYMNLGGKDDYLDLTGIFDNNVSKEEIANYIQGLANEGPMATKSPDYLIDIPNFRRYKKHIQYPTGYDEMPRIDKKRHNSLAMKLKEMINNSTHTGLPNANSKPDLKPNVDKYHYFTVNVKVGDEVIPVVLDAEQLIGESTIKPQTVHLYNFGEK